MFAVVIFSYLLSQDVRQYPAIIDNLSTNFLLLFECPLRSSSKINGKLYVVKYIGLLQTPHRLTQVCRSHLFRFHCRNCNVQHFPHRRNPSRRLPRVTWRPWELGALSIGNFGPKLLSNCPTRILGKESPF